MGRRRTRQRERYFQLETAKLAAQAVSAAAHGSGPIHACPDISSGPHEKEN